MWDWLRRVPDPERSPARRDRNDSAQQELSRGENLFSGIAEATSRLLEGYSDDELAFLLEFIERCNTLSHAETIKLRKESAASTVRPSAREAKKRVRHTVVK